MHNRGRMACRSGRCSPLLLLLFMLGCCCAAAAGAAAGAAASEIPIPIPASKKGIALPRLPTASDVDDTGGKWDLRAFQSFIQARTGGSSGHRECYWVLQGYLSNPFTGDVIAAVRGVEVVRLVGGGPAPCLALEGTKKALQLSSPPSAAGDAAGSPTSQWRALASTLSAKSFRYFHPLTEQPLLTFRPSPRAKPRAVPTAVTSVQAVTYALSRQGHMQLVGESVSGGLLSVRDEGKGATEAGSGSSTGMKKEKALLPWSWPPGFLRRPPRCFELSLLMWPGSKQQQKRPQGTEEGGGGGWGIPWSSLVQFGASSSQPPCRELYTFTTEPTRGKNGRRPRMRYLRYGECPYWCGAGRVCHLTLEGVRYDHFQDIPKADRRLFFPGAEKQPKGKAEGDAAVPSVAAEPALPALPLTMHHFSDEQEREKRRRRKRFFFFFFF